MQELESGSDMLLLYLLLANVFPGDLNPGFYLPDKAQKIIQAEYKGKNISLQKIDWFDPSSGNIIGKTGNLIGYAIEVDGLDSGFAIITQAKGRFDYFDYLLLVTEKGNIQKVKVLKYISEHGGEIRTTKWLDQFIGYQSGTLIYGKDIQAISGATISAGSITHDIQVVMEGLKKYLEKK